MNGQNAYEANGFKNRKEYLADLAENYGKHVYVLVDMLGPNEDFDGLVTELEDIEQEGWEGFE